MWEGGLLEVDHITPLADDGHPTDMTNLQTLCRACHIRKTRVENRTRRPLHPSVAHGRALAPSAGRGPPAPWWPT